ADPAAELPAAMTALEASFRVSAADGEARTVAASEFFLGPLTTAVSPGELLEAVEVPVPPAGSGWAFLEIARVHGAFALAGAAASCEIEITVNGRPVRAEVEARRLLADFLREDLDLRGTHLGCEHGICGACTVLLDGEPARSCLVLAVQADGHEVTTVESLA